jgi:enoyl-CoA hydratase/carnithine racemase
MPPSASGAIRRRNAAVPRVAAALPGVTMRQLGPALVLDFSTPHPTIWSASFTADVVRLLQQCRADARARTVVLTGPGLFDDAPPDSAGPAFATLLEALSAPGSAVVAAIPDAAIGAGLELALACHARTASTRGRMALPGILRGRLPVHGGVSRLARLLPPAAALEMLAFGTVVPAPLGHRLGLLDAVAADPVEAATSLAPALTPALPRLDLHRLRDALRRRAPGEAAPTAALQALIHALSVPPQRALAEIRELAAALSASAQGRALGHAAEAEVVPPPPGNAPLRLRWSLLREAIHLVDEGATPRDVDLALRRFGLRSAPLAAADQDGLDMVAQACVDPLPDAWRQYSPLLDLLIDAGRTGRHAGAGWYRYTAADPRPLPDPALEPLLAESARAGRRRRQPVAEAEIVARCIAALAGEAAALIAGGVPALAVDGMSLRLGFPRWRGGIWHHVQATGPAGFAGRLAAMPTVPPPAAPLRDA